MASFRIHLPIWATCLGCIVPVLSGDEWPYKMTGLPPTVEVLGPSVGTPVRQNLTLPIETVVLHDDNWEDLLHKSGKKAFVLFSAKRCIPCNEMKPDWHAVGKLYKDSPTVIIGEVDCDDYGDLCSRNGVTTFPQAKYYTRENWPMGKSFEDSNMFISLESFVRNDLGGVRSGKTACNLDSKEFCTQRELEILEAYGESDYASIRKEMKKLTKQMSEVLKAPEQQAVTGKYQILKLMARRLKAEKVPGAAGRAESTQELRL
ncbi:unnamed protein product [Polarella glacialis]|uniref:Thioredoxin domain-containing protein n=1 Tax=Polarella glacialis TaxID=89957 RepID=A0A813M071_POLGL|nr:unnamed protein product [Polarella glacialis]